MIYTKVKSSSDIKLYQGDNALYIDEISKIKNIVLITDPPFNINYHYNEYKDNLDEEDYWEWLDSLFNRFNKKVIIHYPEEQYKLSFQMGLFPEKVISWVYNSNLQRQHRSINFYGFKPNFNQVLQPYKNLDDKRIIERINRGILGSKMYDWFYVDQVKNVNREKTSHPAQMPVEVMKRIIATLPKDSIVFDPFMGSGTTGVACKELGYDFIGIELNKEYYEIAKERIKNTIVELDIFDFMEES